MQISETQLRYAKAIAQEPGPVSANDIFMRFGFSMLSLSRMVDAGLVEKEMIDGRSHYRLTRAGITAISA